MKRYLKNMAIMIIFAVALVTMVGVATNEAGDDPYLRDNMVMVQNIGELGFLRNMGSGFLYMNGHIMTAGHVTKGAVSIKITYAVIICPFM